MDQQMQTQNMGMPPQTPTDMQEPMPPHERKYGPLIGIAIVIALIVIGGLYLWGAQLMNEEDTNMPTTPDPMLEQLGSQSSSDELDAIQSDLNATVIDSLDEGAAEVEEELQVR